MVRAMVSLPTVSAGVSRSSVSSALGTRTNVSGTVMSGSTMCEVRISHDRLPKSQGATV